MGQAVSVDVRASTVCRELRRRGRTSLLAAEHAEVVADAEVVGDHEEIERFKRESRLDLKGSALATSSLPYLMTRGQWQATASWFGRFFPVMERVIDLYTESAEVRRFFDLPLRHDSLIRMKVPCTPRISYCRVDFTFDDAGTPRIYELNTHCPGGAVACTDLSRLLGQSAVMAHLVEEHGLRPVPVPLEAPGAFARSMIAAALRNGFELDGHLVAVLNSRYLTLSFELDAIVRQFQEQGLDACRSYVEDLQFSGGRLLVRDRPVAIAFNKYDDSRGPDAFECAFSRTTAEVEAYLNAYAAGAFHPVNTFPAQFLTEQKSTLAFLWSPLARRLLGSEELQLVEELVPHTRLVAQLGSEELARAGASRQGLVLKRSLDTRGRGVVIGATVTDAAWQQALQVARDDAYEHWVLQEAAVAEQQVCRSSPMTTSGLLAHTACACYVFDGRPAGLLVRTSADPATNAARSGFVQPLLVVDELEARE